MYSAYLSAFTASLELSNCSGVHMSALFDEEVGVATTQRFEGVYTAERGDEFRFDYVMVGVVVKSVSSYRKYRTSVNILNTAVGSQMPDPHRANNSTSSSYWRA